jgi:uncharacterized UBP type Zn finger protein
MSEQPAPPPHNYDIYDPSAIFPPFGLINIGSICWWNSLLQTLFSLSSFNKLMLELEDEFKSANNTLGTTYVELIKVATDPANATNNKLEKSSIFLFQGLAHEARRTNKTISLSGQEGVVNGLCVFLELLSNDTIYHVWNNRYERIIKCNHCDKVVSTVVEKSPIISLYCMHDLTTEADYVIYIKKHLSPLSQYNCESCKKEITGSRLELLRLLREIIFINFRKAQSASNRWYPQELHFKSLDGTVLTYKLVSIIEHSGDYNSVTHTSSGHYWNRSFRNNNWYTFNDASMSTSNGEPSASTICIAYHLCSE